MEWTIPSQVYTGVNGLASDPDLIMEGNDLWTYYTDLDPVTLQTVIRRTVNWQNSVPVLTPPQGYKYESASIVKHPTEVYYLYYTRYAVAMEWPRDIGVATSGNGVDFLINDELAIKPSPGAADSFGVQSPSVITELGLFEMIYAGFDDTFKGRLFPAYSFDGVHYTKGNPITFINLPEWAPEQAEPSITKVGHDYWLYFTAIEGETKRIGLATATEWYGPYTVIGGPVVEAMPETFYSNQPNGPCSIDGVNCYFLGYDGTSISIGVTSWEA